MSKPSRPTIRPPQPMRSIQDTPEMSWEKIKSAINHIFSGSSSNLSYEELYRTNYNLVTTNKKGDFVYNKTAEVLESRLNEVLVEINSCESGDSLLRKMSTAWEDFRRALIMIRDILMYLDKSYSAQHSKPGVYDLGVSMFREIVLRSHDRHVGDKVLRVILDRIQAERTGESIEKALMKTVVAMIKEVGTDEHDAFFEARFLKESSEFYEKEAAAWISENTVPEYLLKVSNRLKEEEMRVQYYLIEQTKPKIEAVVRQEMITKQLPALLTNETSGFLCMLKLNKIDDLKRMQELFSPLPAAMTQLQSSLKDHIKEEGTKYVQDKESAKEPVVFTNRLLEMKTKYDTIVKDCFHSTKEFVQANIGAFEAFINLNSRTAEYLSLFLDDKVRNRKDSESEAELDATFDKAMVVLKFLNEKDVFLKFYQQHLARRLLTGKSAANNDTEKTFVSKLKIECGVQQTLKLESMFKDMATSGELNSNYKEYLTDQRIDLPMDMSVQVLTTNAWPSYVQSPCSLPTEMMAGCAVFQEFYLKKHSGRKLNWQFSQGEGTVTAHFPSKKHDLIVPTFQMVILMCFNERDAFTFADLQTTTQIPERELKKGLAGLSLGKHKIITKEPATGKDFLPTDKYTFNKDFKASLVRIKIGNLALKEKEAEEEGQDVRAKVNEDRKPQMEAAIVRVMKARRVIDHNNLVTEVVSQLRSRFTPNPTDLRKCIERLIDQEYMERTEDNRQAYRYLA